MFKTELKIEYTSDTEIERYPVIIVAAGSSNRMQGINKQFLELDGTPVIAHTMLAFENSSLISRIILVTKSEYVCDMQLIAKKYNFRD